MALIGVVVVTFNSAKEIGACLEALREQNVEVVVVDNASPDDTLEQVRRHGAVRLLVNSSNRGFAAAVNQGFAALTTPYVLLLNPDAEVVSGLEELRHACAREGAGLAGGKLVGSDGQLQTGFMVRRLPTVAALILEALLLNRLLPGNRVNRLYRCLDLDYSVAQPVQQPAGAFLMIRRQVWEELGGFDETYYPLWFEDVDFCRRALARGYHPYYTPRAVAKHIGGHTVSRIAVQMKAFYWYRSLLRYAVAHFHPVAARVIAASVIGGSVLRILGTAVVRRNGPPWDIYGKVIGMAGRTLLFGRNAFTL